MYLATNGNEEYELFNVISIPFQFLIKYIFQSYLLDTNVLLNTIANETKQFISSRQISKEHHKLSSHSNHTVSELKVETHLVND